MRRGPYGLPFTLDTIRLSYCEPFDLCTQKWRRTILDMDNLHSSEEFLDFLAQADMDICTDVLGISARFRSDFLHYSARKNLSRNSVRKMTKASHIHMYVQLLVKLSQHCWRPRWYTYTTSSEGDKGTINAVQRYTVALCALATLISSGE